MIVISSYAISNSIEFNGDMMPERDGGHALQGMIHSVDHTKESFELFVEKFNKENHNYEEGELVYHLQDLSFEFDVWRWTSDYLYIKNVRPTHVHLRAEGAFLAKLESGDVAIVHFGELVDIFPHLGKEKEERSAS